MNKLLTLAISAAISLSLMGCTMSEDPADHNRRVLRYANIEAREFVEDIDYLLLIDEPSHLTPYHLPSKPH